MTTREMHIEIDLELQRLDSNITKNFLQQEKDWFLNKEVNKFIAQRLDKQSNRKGTGFQETIKRVEDLKDLIRVEEKIVKTNNRGESCIDLPSNYLKPIRFDSFLKKECKDAIKERGTSYEIKGNLGYSSSTNLTEYTIQLVKEDNSIITLFSIADLPSEYLTVSDFKKQRFLLTKAINIKLENSLKENLSPNTSLYRENVFDFIIESDTNFNSIIITKNENNNIGSSSSTFNVEPIEYRKYATKDLPIKSKVRLINDEYLTEVENSSLSKSVISSPIGVLREDQLILPKCKSAIHGRVLVTYICKPNLIDLLLDSNLNLSRIICEEIVSNTIRFMKTIVQDQNYEAYSRENILIE